MAFPPRDIVQTLGTVAVLLATPPPGGATSAQEPSPPRVVAVGDVHGDAERLRQILREAGLLDQRHAWTGGDAHLVLVGDLVDRGPSSREVVDLVRELEERAPSRVHPLLGNHEAMTVLRDVRYVAPADYAAFAAVGSEALREERYASWTAFLEERAERLGFDAPAPGAAAREQWLRDHPPGFYERQEAFGPDGERGRWLRDLPAALLLDRTVFVHGGLSAERRFPSLEALNAEIRAEIQEFDRRWAELADAGVIWPHATWSEALALVAEEHDLWSAIDSLPAERVDPAALAARPSERVRQRMGELLESETWLLAAADGPLWDRGLATRPESELDWLTSVLESLGAARVAVGHTPTPDHRITARLGGRVLLLDTGLSEAMGGRPAALMIQGNELRAVYPGAPAEPLGASRFEALHGLPLERIESFLRTAAVGPVRPIGRGVTKPWRATLEDGSLSHDAAIQTVDACQEVVIPGVMAAEECDSWRHNVAAYELSKLLGLGAVPPSVARTHEGKPAAFTWWVDEAMTFDEMKARGAAPPDGAEWNRQQWRVGVFDELIFNTDRNQGNLLVDPAWRIWMIDHSRAFRSDPRPRNPEMLGRLRLDDALAAALRELDAGDLEACCAALLEDEQRSALLARRDTILARLTVAATR